MSNATVRFSTHELLWDAWTELGVRGVKPRHLRAAVDPDPLIVFTPALAADEPRLKEQAAAWCERFGGVIVTTRLWGIAKIAPVPVREAFESFVKSLGGTAEHWRRTGSSKSRGPNDHAASLALERPSLARLRMRALAGTGARADVLSELLGAENQWTSAAELDRLGYARRSISRVLDELAAAGILLERPTTRGSRSFRLRNLDALSDLVAARRLYWPDWTALLTLAWRLVDLERTTQKRTKVSAVQLHEAQKEIRRLALGLGNVAEESTSTSALALLTWGHAVLRKHT